MKKWSLLFLVLVIQAEAQTDPFFSHYMFNPAGYNPAAMGDENIAYASFQHRSQWAGYESTLDGSGGAPISQLMTFIIPTSGWIKNAGSVVTLDKQGAENTMRLQFGGVHIISLKSGELSLGLYPGMISRTIDFGQLVFEDPDDPFNTGAKESQTSFDMTAGVFFKTFSGGFAGFSVDHILSPSLIQVEAEGKQIEGKAEPTYYLHGGKSLRLNRDFGITPTLLIRSDLTGFSFDLSGVATYRNLMWGGLSYRRSEAIILLVGYNFLENKELKVGYSFDYVVHDQEAKSPTSHEVFIRYNLPFLTLGGRKAVRTPRFSF